MAVARTAFSKKTTDILEDLNKKTKFTRNLLARVALAMSLEDPKELSEEFSDSAGIAIGHDVLYGKNEKLYRHLAIEWAGTSKINVAGHLRAHIERGVGRLRDFLSTRDLSDLA